MNAPIKRCPAHLVTGRIDICYRARQHVLQRHVPDFVGQHGPVDVREVTPLHPIFPGINEILVEYGTSDVRLEWTYEAYIRLLLVLDFQFLNKL